MSAHYREVDLSMPGLLNSIIIPYFQISDDFYLVDSVFASSRKSNTSPYDDFVALWQVKPSIRHVFSGMTPLLWLSREKIGWLTLLPINRNVSNLFLIIDWYKVNRFFFYFLQIKQISSTASFAMLKYFCYILVVTVIFKEDF